MGQYKTTMGWKYFGKNGSLTGCYISPEFYHIAHRNWEFLNDG